MDNPPHGSAKQELADRLKAASNVLVTVSRNPSVDQLAACIGLGLLLNKQGKHTAAVFSGQVPSALEFLQPEETLEKNTDSLRDFIISLDKTKADKLRYKVENDVVRIFITPYRTSISQEDLDFSQGDFNVDLVIALGVNQQEDLDEAITAHGRILHDATVASITTAMEGSLGSINWQDSQASSLSELVTELAQMLGPDLLDTQIATALLTGIVAETERFSNDKTSSQTMSASAALMSAGANQQLVASQLEQSKQIAGRNAGPAETEEGNDQVSDDGTIRIEHKDGEGQPDETGSSDTESDTETEQPFELPSPAADQPGEPESQSDRRTITEPPTLGGTLTANSREEQLEPTTDPFSLPESEQPQLLERKSAAPLNPLPSTDQPEPPVLTPVPEPVGPPAMTPPPPAWTPPAAPDPQTVAPPTLADIEQRVKEEPDDNKSAGQAAAEPAAELDDAREEVNKALGVDPSSLAVPPEPPAPSLEEQIPGLKAPHEAGESAAHVKDPNAPPPVPPPFMPSQTGSSGDSHQPPK